MAYARGTGPHRPRMRAPTLVGILSVLALACAGEPGVPMNGSDGEPPDVPPWACVPGETQPCPCDDLEGLMTCDPQGAGFGECDCSPGAVSQGPPPTSTGSDSGTASDTGGTADATAGTTGEGSSSGEPVPTTSGSSSGEPDPTTSGGSSGSSTTAG